MVWILVFLLFILIGIFYLTYTRTEFFADLPIIATNHTVNLKMKDVMYRTYDIESWKTNILKNKELEGITSLVCDPYDAQTTFPERSTIPLEVGYFISLMEPTKAFDAECSFQWDGKKIGVLDRSGELFVQALAKGYRIQVTIQTIPEKEWHSLDRFLATNQLDAIVVYFIPMSPMNRLLLGQKLSIMGFNNLDYGRVQASYPFIKTETIDLTYYFRGFTDYILARERTTTVPAMQLQQINLTSTETFITRLDMSSDRFNAVYHCYGDETLDIKGLCNSKYTTFGTPKPLADQITNWDAPCLRNEDCPFYKANEQYPNTRGGCLAFGMCELPVGIQRIGFRKYNDKAPYQPVCHGCVDDPNCCKKQSRPDYAFTDDRDERQKAGLGLDTLN
jgi:hypothetical protein